jgi:hypothetical protein
MIMRKRHRHLVVCLNFVPIQNQYFIDGIPLFLTVSNEYSPARPTALKVTIIAAIFSNLQMLLDENNNDLFLKQLSVQAALNRTQKNLASSKIWLRVLTNSLRIKA